MRKVLIVDDEYPIHSAIERVFRKDAILFFSAFNGNEALDILAKNEFDMILTDIKMPEMDGIMLLEKIKDIYPNLIRLILTGYGTTDEVVRAMKLGADDFLDKYCSEETLYQRVMQNLNTLIERDPDPIDSSPFLMGESKCIREVRNRIRRVSRSDVNILIQGEPGTGSELIAEIVHYCSPRKNRPFISCNFKSFNEADFEKKLFGFHTDADTDITGTGPGYIQAAYGGTLFMDEIEALSFQSQVKLLQTFHNRNTRPEGDLRNPPPDIRIITGTSTELGDEVRKDSFHKELFFHLNVVSLDLPPLRRRREDIPLLVSHFIGNKRIKSSPVRDIEEETLSILKGYSWPGNVQELENVITEAVAFGTNRSIAASNLPDYIVSRPDDTPDADEPESVHELEITAIRRAMKKYGGNKKAAAEALGIGIATLYRKLRQYDISDA